jgi:biotin transport system substrate-specific component
MSLSEAAAPLRGLVHGSLARRTAIVVLGSWAIALSAWIAVPMYPVPMTMQTFAILVLAALGGARLAVEIVVAYLLQGAIGLPVFAAGHAGLAYMAGPTAGFLLGFVLMAALVGHLADRGWMRGLVPALGALALGHALVFVPGVAWLAGFVGLGAALAAGLTPFILGSLVKVGLAAAVTWPLCRRRADPAG